MAAIIYNVIVMVPHNLLTVGDLDTLAPLHINAKNVAFAILGTFTDCYANDASSISEDLSFLVRTGGAGAWPTRVHRPWAPAGPPS